MIRKPPSPAAISLTAAPGAKAGLTAAPHLLGRRGLMAGALATLAVGSDVDAGGGGAGPSPARSRKLAVAGLNFPGSDDATGNTTGEGWTLSYDRLPLIGPCDNLQAAFVNAHMSGGGAEAGDGQPATYAVAYEYPAGSGVLHAATWKGAPTVTVASGDLSPFHDPVSIPGLATAPAGGLIGVQTLWRGTDDAYVNAYSHRPGPSARKLVGRNAAGAPMATATERSGWTAAGDLLMPVLITAERDGDDVAEVYVGDSITVDQAHTVDGYGVAGFAQEADLTRGALKLCATGDALTGQAARFAIRAAVIAAVPEHRINIHVNLGVNDLSAASADAASMLAELAALTAQLKAAAPGRARVYPMTISPRIDSGTPTGPAKRTAFNAGVTAGVAGADGVYAFGAWAEAPNAPDSGVWGSVGGASKEGGDQIHPRWFDAAVRADLLASRRAWRAAQGL